MGGRDTAQAEKLIIEKPADGTSVSYSILPGQVIQIWEVSEITLAREGSNLIFLTDGQGKAVLENFFEIDPDTAPLFECPAGNIIESRSLIEYWDRSPIPGLSDEASDAMQLDGKGTAAEHACGEDGEGLDSSGAFSLADILESDHGFGDFMQYHGPERMCASGAASGYPAAGFEFYHADESGLSPEALSLFIS